MRIRQFLMKFQVCAKKKKILNLKISASKKFIFRQLVANFADFRQNNSMHEKKKKIAHLKILATRKVHILTVNPEFYRFLAV